MVIADAYNKGNKSRTPTGQHNKFDCIYSIAKAQNLTINHWFKEFHCLKNIYRHDKQEHYKFFAPCAFLVKLTIEKDGGKFDIEYKVEGEEV